MKLSAAKYVDNQLKTQASQLMAQQNRTAPPPVNQQTVASMAGAPQGQPAPQQMAQGLPEETGIGALPVPEMNHMAAGGIVAFGEGGLNDALAAVDASMPDPRVDPSGFNRFGGSMTDYLNARQKAIQAVKYNLTPENPESLQAYESTYGANYRSGPELRKAEPSKGVPYIGSGVPSASVAALRSGASTQAGANAQAARAAAPQGGTGAVPRAGTGARTGTAQEVPADLKALYEGMMPKEPVADPYATENAQNAADRNAINEGKRVVAKERAEGLAALLAPKEQRIKDKEERLKKSDDMNVNMALINAGLAMMQSRGQGLAGIAEGAGVGVKQYSEGLKLSEAARQKIEDAKDAFDELKFNQTNMSKKEIADAEAAVKEGAIVSRNEGIASRQKATGEKRDDAKAVFGALKDQILQKDNQRFQIQQDALKMENALRAAGISANAGTAAKIAMLERLGAADPNSPLYKGYLMTVQESQEPMLYKVYTDKTSDMANGDKFKAQYPTFELYKAGMSGGGGGNFVQKPPAGANILPPK
jgi:hypothetical protein